MKCTAMFALMDKHSSEAETERIAHLEQLVERLTVALDIHKKLSEQSAEIPQAHIRGDADMRTSQWSGPIPVKEVVYAGVLKFTGGNTNITFAIRDIKPIISEMYPDFKLSNVDAEITADCVNSPSRHHYSVNEDRYWKVGYGTYRLYDLRKTNCSNTENQMEMEGMKHVFISYIRENQEEVDRLCDALRSHDIEVWLDRDAIRPGTRWKVAIRNAIRAGSFFIACFSKERKQRDKSYMNQELTLAIDELRQYSADRVWFIPIKLNECEIPDLEISGSETLNDFQHVSLYEDWNGGIQSILEVIQPEFPSDQRDSSVSEHVHSSTNASSEAIEITSDQNTEFPSDQRDSSKGAKYQSYMQLLIDELREEHNFTRARVGQPVNWYSFSSGIRGISYRVKFVERDTEFAQRDTVRTYVNIDNNVRANRLDLFDALEARKVQLESAFGSPLVWERLEEQQRSRIVVSRHGNIELPDAELERIRAWHIANLLKLKAVFLPEIKNALETLA